MAGAFIAVCDDATASSWNPGGFIQLRKPEVSVVYASLSRKESNEFGFHPESSHTGTVFDHHLNFFSLVYPFKMINRNMSLALTWQHLYDFNRSWSFKITEPRWLDTDNWKYHQTGRLSSIGFSYCTQIIPRLSAGITINLWKNIHLSNQWQQHYQQIVSDRDGEVLFWGNSRETYEFSGINLNFGLLWRINAHLSTGLVFKTPFNADILYSKSEHWTDFTNPLNPDGNSNETSNDSMHMPLTAGLGIRYQMSDAFLIAADISHTNWKTFSYETEKGQTICPIDGKPVNKSKAKDTTQIRCGFEYLYIDQNAGFIIPLRAGIFYDPTPAVDARDNFYGLSIGSGLSFLSSQRFSLDMAYTLRHGNDIGKSILKHLDFQQDVIEHLFYLSLIRYL
ncbi:MAG: outer membrane protein transport protein [Candidatus Magnetomorum sp.]|nr:outer membrane protein transport protein [Candidatus Magnetomorum sp.]